MAVMSGCFDTILDKGLVSNISDSDVWKEPKLADRYLAGCYNQMNFTFDANGNMDHNTTSGPQHPFSNLCIADEACASAPMSVPRPASMTLDRPLLVYWKYSLLRNLHLFMDKLNSPECTFTQEFKENRTAEARFLRAFIYFNMVKRYGGVPLVTKAIDLKTATDAEIYPERAKEQAIYDFILSELDDLIQNNRLPKVQTDKGRPTYWAALALKSRTALFAASLARYETRYNETPYEGGIIGIPKELDIDYYQMCVEACQEIIENGGFDLYRQGINGTKQGYIDNYRQLFLQENNCEVIFSEIFDGYSGKGHSYDMWVCPRRANIWTNGNCVTPFKSMIESYEMEDGTTQELYITSNQQDNIGSGSVARSIEEIFGGREPRFYATIYKQEDTYLIKGIRDTIDYRAGVYKDGKVYKGKNINIPGVEGELAEGLYYTNSNVPTFGILKYLDENGRSPAERLYSDTDYIIFRLGEIYLNLAEAAFEIGTPEMIHVATEAINKIRERAGAPDFLTFRDEATLTLEQIRHERKIELAFEGGRYWDLVRWRIAKKISNGTQQGYRYILDWNTRYTKPHKYFVFPTNAPFGNQVENYGDQHYYLPFNKSELNANQNLINNPGYAE